MHQLLWGEDLALDNSKDVAILQCLRGIWKLFEDVQTQVDLRMTNGILFPVHTSVDGWIETCKIKILYLLALGMIDLDKVLESLRLPTFEGCSRIQGASPECLDVGFCKLLEDWVRHDLLVELASPGADVDESAIRSLLIGSKGHQPGLFVFGTSQPAVQDIVPQMQTLGTAVPITSIVLENVSLAILIHSIAIDFVAHYRDLLRVPSVSQFDQIELPAHPSEPDQGFGGGLPLVSPGRNKGDGGRLHVEGPVECIDVGGEGDGLENFNGWMLLLSRLQELLEA